MSLEIIYKCLHVFIMTARIHLLSHSRSRSLGRSRSWSHFLSHSPSTCYPLKSVSLSLSPCSDLLFKLPKFHSLFRFTPASFLCSLSHLWLPNFQYLSISLTYLNLLGCLIPLTLSLQPLSLSPSLSLSFVSLSWPSP